MRSRPCHLAAPCIVVLAGCSLLLDAGPKDGDVATDDVFQDETAVDDLPDTDRIEGEGEADPDGGDDGVQDPDADAQEEDGSPPPDVVGDETGEPCDVTAVMACIRPEKDTTIDQWDDQNYGTSDSLHIYRESGIIVARSLVQFNLSDLSSAMDVRKAELLLYYHSWDTEPPGDASASVYEITGPWVENSVRWADGTGFATDAVSSTPIVEGGYAVDECVWDVTPTLLRWLGGSLPNNGVMIEPDTNKNYWFQSWDHGDESRAPCLRVTVGSCP